MSKKFSITMESEEQKELFQEIALMQGFPNLNVMARVALFQYVDRYKLQEKHSRLSAVQHRPIEVSITDIGGVE